VSSDFEKEESSQEWVTQREFSVRVQRADLDHFSFEPAAIEPAALEALLLMHRMMPDSEGWGSGSRMVEGLITKAYNNIRDRSDIAARHLLFYLLRHSLVSRPSREASTVHL
jgi:hypothetical protein